MYKYINDFNNIYFVEREILYVKNTILFLDSNLRYSLLVFLAQK
jgi:hypothetical protein